MADKSRPKQRRIRAAYEVRSDQGSDPKPKSRLARKLAKLPLPKGAVSAKPAVRQPDGALYEIDEQKAFAFADLPDVARFEAQPFLKWAGGKGSLLTTLDEFFPSEVERYIEPFLGGGAVFFHLKRCFPHMRAFLRDCNEELINCYRIVRDRTQELMLRLDVHAAAFRKRGEDYYYEVRGLHRLADNAEFREPAVFGLSFRWVNGNIRATDMKQHDAVIEVMRANGGYATLGLLYREALKVPGVEWKTKTPFKSINRIVQDDRFFFRIQLGLWALKECKDTLPAQIKKLDKPEFNHTYYQGLLVELGNLRRFETSVPPQDRGKKFMEKPLGEAATVQQLHQFTYPEVVKRAQSVDVIWFNPRKMPNAFFEVEHTTGFDNSLLRFVHFQDFNIDFRIVAAKDRQKEFTAKIAHPSFAPIAPRTRFTSYELVSELHTKAHEVAGLESQWTT